MPDEDEAQSAALATGIIGAPDRIKITAVAITSRVILHFNVLNIVSLLGLD